MSIVKRQYAGPIAAGIGAYLANYAKYAIKRKLDSYVFGDNSPLSSPPGYSSPLKRGSPAPGFKRTVRGRYNYRPRMKMVKETAHPTDHTRQIKVRKLNKGYARRGKKYFSKKQYGAIKKCVKNYVKFSHGAKAEVELWQKYYLNTSSTVTTDGNLSCSPDNLNHAFIPLFSDDVMNDEFRIGENATSNPNKFGIIDPPPDVNSGGAGAANVNLIKDRESIYIDSYLVRLYITNPADTKVMIFLTEWVCQDESDQDIVSKATDLYNKQQYFVLNSLPAVASVNLFKQPNFQANKVPHLAKFWKRGKFFKKLELKPGESAEVFVPYNKMVWNQAKLEDTDEDNTQQNYHKGLSRFIQITIRGEVGQSTNGESFFQAAEVNFQIMKKIVAHRMDRFAMEARRYIVNPTLVTSYEGTAVSETRPTTPVANPTSQIWALQANS
jgi:hypothetical protein